jgi:hypothetical protein
MTKGRLNSWGRPPYNAIRLLAKAGFIQINEERGERLLATCLPRADQVREQRRE